MKNHTTHTLSWWVIALLLGSSGFYLVNCTGTPDNTATEENTSMTAQPEALFDVNETHALHDVAYDSLFHPYPPHDVSSTNPSNKELAIFAWRQMIALNWQSSYQSSGSSNIRAEPDLKWNYGNNTDSFPTQPVVWETYAHRTEFSPYNEKVPQQPFDSAPQYPFETVTYPGGSGSNAVFNFLDEDNEIGSCYLFSLEPQDSLMVMYQAKVNRSEYNYIYQNYADDTVLSTAVKSTGTNIKNNNYYYPPPPGGPSNCDCPPGVFCLPCGENGDSEEGAIEIKTAWRVAHKGEDISPFFHREVMYMANGATAPTMGTFLLIGMHIIHKTVNMPEFIFATWEHESVTAGSNNESYTYIPISANDTATINGHTIIENTGVPLPVQRLHPVDSLAYFTVSNTVHAMINAKNPNNVLQNYRLVGVQAQIVNYAQRDSIPSYFLANYVIESDLALQDFYGSFGHSQDGNPNILNVGASAKVTMGGCKGCHGQAQLSGSDFSFVVQAFDPEPDLLFRSFSTSIAKAKGQ